MSERFFETPTTNVTHAAIKLGRHKLLVQMASGSRYPSLSLEDFNEMLVVAGLPVIVPEEINAKEVEVIKVEREADYDNAE